MQEAIPQPREWPLLVYSCVGAGKAVYAPGYPSRMSLATLVWG